MNAKRPLAPALARTQLGWIAALLLLAQLPLWGHLPTWTVFAGTSLIAARVALPRQRNIGRWLLPLLAAAAAIGIRWQFGYFLARDPCVAFLYVLVGIKFLEARSVRDGGLLVCLGLFLLLTQFFYAQTILAARR